MLKHCSGLYFLIVGVVCVPLRNGYPLTNPCKKSREFQGDIKIDNGIGPRNVMRSGHWPRGIVPYDFDRVFNPSALSVIQQAMRTIESVISSRGITDGSCQLRFVPRTQQHRNFIYFTSFGPQKCWSYFGVRGGPQPISLGHGCFRLHTVIHELLHALGFAHQQSAHNRDQYLRIHLENVEECERYNFDLKNEYYFTDFGLGYDYKSIMQYPPFAFARRGPDGRFVGPTISARDPRIKLEENTRLSEMDKIKLQLIYCKKHTKLQFEN